MRFTVESPRNRGFLGWVRGELMWWRFVLASPFCHRFGHKPFENTTGGVCQRCGAAA